MSKGKITVTHPNGEVTVRRSDRPYEYVVVALITTDLELGSLAYKRGLLSNELDAYTALANGEATIEVSRCSYRNGCSIRQTLHHNEKQFGIDASVVPWKETHIRLDNEEDWDDFDADAHFPALEQKADAILKSNIQKRIKNLTGRINKIDKQIAHIESLGGTTYNVESWHSRRDLAQVAMSKYMQHSDDQFYITQIDQH